MAEIQKPVKLVSIQLASREKELFNGKAPFVIVPALDGDIGVVASHTPFLSPLREGVVKIKKDEDSWTTFNIKAGFVEVIDDCVTILVQA